MTVMLVTFEQQAACTAIGGASILKSTSLSLHFPACCHAMVGANARESIALSLFALEAAVRRKLCITSSGCTSREVGAGESADSSNLLEAGLRCCV
jgi:hypothetical protein